jgi:hypothetical protein
VRWPGIRSALCCAAACLVACSGTIAGDDGSNGSPNGSPNGVSGAGGVAGGGSGNGASGSSGDGGVTGGSFLASDSVARRLSRAEFDNTVRDLLGDDTRPATRLLAEDLYAPYDNDYRTQIASGALIDSLEGLATDVATRAVSAPELRARLVPCTPTGPGDAACFAEVAESFVRRAFRRPVDSAELDAYATLLDFATEDNPDVVHDFYTAVALLVRSVLQDPEFLYRIEIGEDTGDQRIFALNDHEIAARMSYLLWGSTPDDALRAQAEAGRLTDADARLEIAREMLGDDRARDQLHRFHAMWLGYRAIPHPAELTSAFHRETSALIDRVVFEDAQDYLRLFTLEETFVDTMLAEHYGLPAPRGGEAWVPYGDSGRAGILSHGSVLSAFSKFTDTSPTQRGIFVRTRLLCQTVLRPPAEVNSDQPPGQMEATCKADRYAQHSSSGACAGCHSQLDPIGFGLENYDVAGRFREHDEGLPECTIDGRGEVIGEGTFSGPGELGALLVAEGLLEPCIVQQVFQFAIGRPPAEDEASALAELSAAFARDDRDFAALFVSLVQSEAFALRKEPSP